jgi:hypothetical protein
MNRVYNTQPDYTSSPEGSLKLSTLISKEWLNNLNTLLDY